MDKRHNQKSRHIYQIFGVCLLCVLIICLVYESTSAWFLDNSTTSNGDPNITIIGTLELEVQTNFNFYNLALQPDYTYVVDKDNEAIGTYIKTKDGEHDIDGAFVRVKYTTRRKAEGDSEWVDNSDLLSLYFHPDNEDKWVYNSTDGYYYYLGSVYNEFVEFNKGYSTSYKIGNEYKNAQVEIDIKVESVQRQYGAYHEVWPNAPEQFNTFAYNEMNEGDRVHGN